MENAGYGWRGRIGFVLPTFDDGITYEFYRMAPAGVVVVTTSLRLHRLTLENIEAASNQFDAAAQDVAREDVDLVMLLGSPLVFFKGYSYDAELTRRVQAMVKVPVLTGMRAEVEALTRLGVRRWVLATPYQGPLNSLLKSFLEAAGFAVPHVRGLGIERNADIAHQPIHAACRLAREVFREAPECEGIFIHCPRWATIGHIETLEQECGVPVVSSATAITWAALHHVGAAGGIRGYGRLLELD